MQGRVRIAAIAFAAVAMLGGCIQETPAPPQPREPVVFVAPPLPACPPGFTQHGRASWYGKAHEGRKTASGERFDTDGLTAAHRTLPMGTRIEVENLNNSRKVTVTVNDRGPFVRGRIVDVSEAAAHELGFARKGTVPVRITGVTACDGAMNEAAARP